MIDARRAQRTFGDGFVADAVPNWQEAWMPHADQILDDDTIVAAVYEALGRRRPQSRTRGRRGTSAESVLRLLVLKHLRNWSYATLEREVRTNLLYRQFTRVGGGPTPDAKTMGRWGVAVGPAVIAQIHRRLVAVARQEGLIQGRRLRVDTTVIERNIHYPTDSSLLSDGVRVLTRTMQQITAIAGAVGTRLRDRRRSVTRRLLAIMRITRRKGVPRQAPLADAYRQLLDTTSRVVGQATRFAHEVATGVKTAADLVDRAALDGLRARLETFVPRVRQVMRQARARIFQGNTHVPDKIVSLFEPTTEVIRKGKASKPTEFGTIVKLQEAEHQIITDYVVYPTRPASDAALLTPALDVHADRLGRMPHLVAADAGFYSARNEAAAHAAGVRWVCVPNRSTKDPARRRLQKTRWFKHGQKWRTGCEGRISVVKRRHGLTRCRYRGDAGMARWVGLGVVADTLVNMGRVRTTRPPA